MNESQIFQGALQLANPTERSAFLAERCGDNCQLRADVEGLLELHESDRDFLEQPVSAPALTTDQTGGARPGTQIGPYKLLEQIGEGGMGLVFMAEQQQPVRRLVALKIIKPGMDSKQVIARFEAERQALAMMDHPNIAKVLEAGTVGQSTKSQASSIKQIRSTKSKAPNEPSSTVSSIDPSDLEIVCDLELGHCDLTANRPYFVMELVRGIPINEFCEQQKLTVRQRLALFMQVCQAVQHAHQKGIIHRDLKPTNVLVTMNDVLPIPKVIDFGIAKALSPLPLPLGEGRGEGGYTLHTGFSQLVGTPMYMSPEQAQMNQLGVDTRSDVYSLGVLLYELLTGTTPFDKERLKSVGFDEMRRIIREEEPETVSARIARTQKTGTRDSGFGTKGSTSEGRLSTPSPEPRTPRHTELDWIVMKALEKDRTRRYESASALAADIQRYLNDEPVHAYPPTTMYRFQKFARKHKPALVTAAAIALCLLLGTTVSAWQAVRATTAEAQATANEQKAATERDEVKALNAKLAAKEQQLQKALYSAHVNLARRAWEAGSVEQADELLLRQRPRADEPDQRNFEWHYLHRLCHSHLLALDGHTDDVYDVAFSPNGTRLASASRDQTVKVWDAQTGKELLTLRGHTGRVASVAFSPDGKRVASCTRNSQPGQNGTAGGLGIKVWNAETGEQLLHIPEGSGLVAYSPDGKQLASTPWSVNESRSLVKIWDAQTGKELIECKGKTGEVFHLAFSPDGKRLATAAGGKSAKVWDVETGEEVLSLAGGWGGLDFSQDGKRLVTVGQDEMSKEWQAKVWNFHTGEKLTSMKIDGFNVAFSPDGKHLVTSSQEKPLWPERTLHIWDLETSKEVRAIKGAGKTVVYSPDGRHLATCSIEGSTDYTVKIWDAEKDQDRLVLKKKFGNFIAISPDGKYLASGSGNDLILWDARSGQVAQTLQGHKVTVMGVAFSPDGKRIVSGGSGSLDTAGWSGNKNVPPEVKIWDAQTYQELLSITDPREPNETGPGSGSSVFGVAFSPDGKRVASAKRVWDAQTGQKLLTLTGRGGWGRGVAFSPDGKYIATGGGDRSGDKDATEAKLFDAQSGQELHTFRGGGLGVAFTPDSKRLASAATQPAVKVWMWDVETRREIFTVKGGGYGVAISADGKRLASGGKVWNAENGDELLSLRLDHNGYGIAFSPDGHRLACAEWSTVTIFDATPLPEKP